MKEYILLFRGGFDRIKNQSPEEFTANMEQRQKWLSDLGNAGKIVEARPLIPTGKHVVGKEKVVGRNKGNCRDGGHNRRILKGLERYSTEEFMTVPVVSPLSNSTASVRHHYDINKKVMEDL